SARLRRRERVAAEPAQQEVGDALDLGELGELARLALGDREPRAVANHLEGRAVELLRAEVAHATELAQHREASRVEVARALDAQVAILVEVSLGPGALRQCLELLLCPGE